MEETVPVDIAHNHVGHPILNFFIGVKRRPKEGVQRIKVGLVYISLLLLDNLAPIDTVLPFHPLDWQLAFVVREDFAFEVDYGGFNLIADAS